MRIGYLAVTAAVAASSFAATGAVDSVTVVDPCGDLTGVSTPAGDVRPEPEAWRRNDLASVTVVEVLDESGRAVGVDLVVETCGDAAPPDRPGESLRVGWSLPDGCRVEAQLDQPPRGVYVMGDIGLVLGADDAVAVTCPEPRLGGMATEWVSEHRILLDPDRIRREGRTTTVELRAAELGELGSHVSAGAVITAPGATSYAHLGVNVALPGASDIEGAVGVVDRTGSAPDLVLD